MASEYLPNREFEAILANFKKYEIEKMRSKLLLEDLQNSEERKLKRRRNYPENPQLVEKQEAYDEIAQGFKQSHHQLANAFWLLSSNIVRYAKFSLIDDEDAIQEGVVICFEKMDRFVPTKGRAFNYFTTCILNHFRQMYRTARNFQEFKKKYLEFLECKLESNLNSRKTKQQPKYNDYQEKQW